MDPLDVLAHEELPGQAVRGHLPLGGQFRNDFEDKTAEIVPELADSAAARLEELGYDNIQVRQGDGYYGWPEEAPFDAIIVTAAPDHLPAPLAEQLSPDGRLVIPIGPPGGYQSLWFVQRHGEDIDMNRMLDVMFVPFTREADE